MPTVGVTDDAGGASKHTDQVPTKPMLRNSETPALHSVCPSSPLIQTESEDVDPRTAPNDRCYLVAIAAVFLGALSSAFGALTASPHFLVNYYASFRIDASSLQYPNFWKNSPSVVGCLYFVANASFQAVALRFRGWNRERQVTVSFAGLTVGFCLLMLLPAWIGPTYEALAIAILLFCTVWISLFAAFAQSTTFGIAGRLPPRYTLAAPLGIGVSGFVAAALRLCLVFGDPAPEPDDFREEAYIFYGIVAATNLTAAAGANWFLRRNAFSASHLQSKTVNLVANSQSSIRTWFWTTKDLLFVNCSIMVGSYSMYPGVAARDVDNDRLWGVIVFMAFNVASTAGRLLTVFLPEPSDLNAARRRLVGSSILRLPIIIVPSLIGLYSVLFNAVEGRTVAIIVQLFSGFTNGLGSAYAYYVTQHKYGETNSDVSRLMTISMSTGLAVGGILGMVLCTAAR